MVTVFQMIQTNIDIFPSFKKQSLEKDNAWSVVLGNLMVFFDIMIFVRTITKQTIVIIISSMSDTTNKANTP